MHLLQAQPIQAQGSSLSAESLRQAFAPRRRASGEEPPKVVDEHRWPGRLSRGRTVHSRICIESKDGG
jgi:hypothetical protein